MLATSHVLCDNQSLMLKTIDGNGNEIRMEYSGVNGYSSCSGGGSNQLSRIIYLTFEMLGKGSSLPLTLILKNDKQSACHEPLE